MIIGLFGEESPLKARLRDYLTNRSFYLCACSELVRLEGDRNYVVDALDTVRELQILKDHKSSLVWVGENGENLSDFDLVLSWEESEPGAQERLNQLILREMRKPGRPDWDEYFMKIAQVASMRSNCIKRKVGAVIVKDKRIISTGYNGTPRGTKNCNEGGCPRCNSLASSGTRLEECLCSHAEENAITQAAYHGTTVKDGIIYTTFAPCLLCSKMIINSGIVEVIFNIDYPVSDTSFRLFEEAGVKIRQHQLT
jgi:dCMP deaminase